MTVIVLRVKMPGGLEDRGEMIAMHLEDILRRYGWAEVQVTSAREVPDGDQMDMMGGRQWKRK